MDTDDEEDAKSSVYEDDGEVREIAESEEEQFEEEDDQLGLLDQAMSQSDSDDDLPLVRNRQFLDSDGEDSEDDSLPLIGNRAPHWTDSPKVGLL